MADGRLCSIVPLPIARDPALSFNAKVVAMGIGGHMFRDGSCSPGYPAIAAACGASLRQVERGVAELRAAHHLASERGQRRNATLRWLHPLPGQTPNTDENGNGSLIRHTLADQKTLLIRQKGPLDPPKSGALRFLDPPTDITRARTNEKSFNEVNENKQRSMNRSQHTAGENEKPQTARRSITEPVSIGDVDWRKIINDPGPRPP